MKNGKNILKDGTIKYFQSHQLHREEGPAVIYPNGSFEFWDYGNQYKQYGNTFISRSKPTFYNKDTFLRRVVRVNNKGEIHHTTKPALINYNHKGDKCSEIYFKNGKWHNENGPARFDFGINKRVVYKNYWLNNKPVTPDEWKIKTRNLKLERLLKNG